MSHHFTTEDACNSLEHVRCAVVGSLQERRTERAAAAGVLVDSSVSAERRAARDARLLGSFSSP